MLTPLTEVVCEGVETKIQEKILKKLGCNYVQGSLYIGKTTMQRKRETLDTTILRFKINPLQLFE